MASAVAVAALLITFFGISTDCATAASMKQADRTHSNVSFTAHAVAIAVLLSTLCGIRTTHRATVASMLTMQTAWYYYSDAKQGDADKGKNQLELNGPHAVDKGNDELELNGPYAVAVNGRPCGCSTSFRPLLRLAGRPSGNDSGHFHSSWGALVQHGT